MVTVTLKWENISDISEGDSYARIRLTTEDIDRTTEATGRDDASVGIAGDGEVEDYQIAIACFLSNNYKLSSG